MLLYHADSKLEECYVSNKQQMLVFHADSKLEKCSDKTLFDTMWPNFSVNRP